MVEGTEKPVETLVIYHAGCADGFTAAWVVKNYSDVKNVKFYAAGHGSTPPRVQGMHVIMLDFCFPRDETLRMKAEALSLIVYDHHQTTAANCGDLEYVRVDQSHSGAMLAWMFYGDCALEVPDLVRYVEDRDLWNWKLNMSKEINAVIQGTAYTFNNWDALHKRMLYHGLEPITEEGLALLRAEGKLVNMAIGGTGRKGFLDPANFIPSTKPDAEPNELELELIRVFAVNSPVLQSVIGHKVCEDMGHSIAAIWCADQKGCFVVSLRSAENGPNVEEIARARGGGHPHAAGYRTEDFPIG